RTAAGRRAKSHDLFRRHRRRIARDRCREGVDRVSHVAGRRAGDSPDRSGSHKERKPMKRYVAVAVFTLMAAAALLAQAAPKGWKVRVDRSTTASDPDAAGSVKLVTMGTGFHATNPQAAVYWNPGNAASGSYTLKGTFTLMKPSGHTNYYGLVFGGSALDGA